MDYCILTAGLGTRFRPLANFLNKGLAPYPFRPLLSIIIDQIPINSNIHIVLGYLGADVEYILKKFHPDRTFFFYYMTQACVSSVTNDGVILSRLVLRLSILHIRWCLNTHCA